MPKRKTQGGGPPAPQKEYDVPLTEQELAAMGEEHLELLEEVDELEDYKRAQTQELVGSIKAKKKKAKELRKCLRTRMQRRPVKVRIEPDPVHNVKRVLWIEREPPILLEEVTMTPEELHAARQIEMPDMPSPGAEA